jgi:hypothetical protein
VGALNVKNVRARGLHVNAGSVNVLPDGSPLGVVMVNDLTVAGGAVLDLADNDLVVSYGTGANPMTTIRDYVFNGYSPTPDPSKQGIVSSAGQAAGNTILALIDNAFAGATDWPLGSGQTIGANSVIGKYTYFGDANFDGQVTADDYGVLDANLGTTPALGIAWLSGDANLDGTVTADDYSVLDANLGSGLGSPLMPASVVAVPEPVVTWCALGLMAVRRRRRR